MMTKRSNEPDITSSADPIEHLTRGFEPLARAALRPGKRSRTKRRDQVVRWVVIALIVGLAAMSLIAFGLMLR
jgi:hypothetical protein